MNDTTDNGRFLATVQIGDNVVLINPQDGQPTGILEVDGFSPDDDAIDDDTMVTLKGPDDTTLEVRADQLRHATKADFPKRRVRLTLDLDVCTDTNEICVEDMVGMLIANTRSALNQGLLTVDTESVLVDHQISASLDSDPTIVVIEMQGGVVHEVHGAGEAEVIVLDYDIEGRDDYVEIPGGGFLGNEATVSSYRIEGEDKRGYASDIFELANSPE